MVQPAAGMAGPQAAAAFAAYDPLGAGAAAPKKAIPEWLRDEMKKRVIDSSGESSIAHTPLALM